MRRACNVICRSVRSIPAGHRRQAWHFIVRTVLFATVGEFDFEIQCLLPRLCEMGPREARMGEREKLHQAQEIQRELNDKGLSRRAFLDRLKILGVGFGAAAMLGVRDADADWPAPGLEDTLLS
jgi:nitroreductase